MPQPMPTTPQPTHPLMGGISRIDPRHEVERQVALSFEEVDRRVSAEALNISAHGMFIRSREARPEGSPVGFELSLAGTGRRIHGAGEVVWTRRFELAADRPAGMGIRFLDLDEESRRTLASFIDQQSDSGDRLGQTPLGGATWTSSTYVDPLSCLTTSQQHKLYAFAGSASAGPRRQWNRRVRRALSSVKRALRWRR